LLLEGSAGVVQSNAEAEGFDTWPEEVRQAAKGWTIIQGDHSIQDDMLAVNQNFSAGMGYRYNCGNCAWAFELRRRGFDVEAEPHLGRYNEEYWKSAFKDFSPVIPKSTNGIELFEELTRKISLWGEGARGTVLCNLEGRSLGHVFSVEVTKDMGIIFVDSQEKVNITAEYFNRMIPSSVKYGRLDNLAPSANVINTVRNRRRYGDV
jgi:hypothetical protein